MTKRVINVWRSLPDWIVTANTTNTFKNRFDKFWLTHEVVYDFSRITNNCKQLETEAKCKNRNLLDIYIVVSYRRGGHRSTDLRPYIPCTLTS